MGSKTLFKAVFIRPEQVVRFYACILAETSAVAVALLQFRNEESERSHATFSVLHWGRKSSRHPWRDNIPEAFEW